MGSQEKHFDMEIALEMIQVIIKLNMIFPCTNIIGPAYISGAPEIIPVFLWGFCMLVNN
jgi:hypothetical protein